MQNKYRSWLEISHNRIQKNISNIKRCIGKDVLLMAVVKANAYGVGIQEIVNITKFVVDWYGVNSLEEANIVRKNCSKPILILGYVTNNNIQEVVKKNYSLLVYNYRTINLLSKYSTSFKKAKIHIKIDTGLTRLGLLVEDLPNFIKHVQKISNIEVEGLCTHYARLMDKNDNNIYQYQLNKFRQAEGILQKFGISTRIKHTASSMAAVLYKKTRFNMVRIGILIYGLWGGQDIIPLVKRKGGKINIYSTLSWKARVINIKIVFKGISAGYMNLWTAKKKTKVAIISIGYYDGLDRRYAEKGKVLINGQFAKIIGKITMNMCMVNISKIKNVKIGDAVVIIGKSKEKEITVYDIAGAINTSTYEVITRINPLTPKVLI